VFFAMSASVIFYYAFSVLFSRKKRVEIRGSMIGTLAGAIIYGPIAGTCENIGAAIAVGLFSGIISAFFFEKLYPKINKRGIRDSLGGLLVLAISLIGSLIVAPIILIAYKNAGLSL
jgi:ammonia channel protein AmtB